MFITENQNVSDSILFLLSARAALTNVVESRAPENQFELVDFINNEASDYEIMHLMLRGTLPKEKESVVGEMMLFSEFKEQMLMNSNTVIEMVGEDIFSNVLNEVDCLYGEASTKLPVLESICEDNYEVKLAYTLHEQYVHEGAVETLRRGIEDLTLKVKDTADPSLKGKLMRRLALQKDRLARLLKQKGGEASDAAGDAAAAAKKKGAALAKAGKAKYAELAPKVKAKGSAYASKAASYLKQTGKNVAGQAQDLAQKGTAAAKKMAPKAKAAVSNFAQTPAGQAVGAAAAATLAIYAGSKVYKRMFSKAARACGDKKGAEKTLCMRQYRKQALQKQIATVKSFSSKCAKSKDPQACKAAINKRVAGLQNKMSKLG